MKHKKFRHLVATSLALSIFTGCGDSDDKNPLPAKPPTNVIGTSPEGTSSINLVNTITTDSRFQTLSDALSAAGLIDVLLSADFTVFAPTDEAFTKLPEGQLEQLLANPELLKEVLLYHVVVGKLSAQNVIATESLSSVSDLGLSIRVVDGAVFINDSQVIATDLQATNGVIHAIDQVLLPSTMFTVAELADKNDMLATLFTAVKAAGLAETLQGEGPFTVFAPNNAAFAAIGQDQLDDLLLQADQLRDILLFHVVAGRFDAATVLQTAEFTSALGEILKVESRDDGYYINNARLVTTDIKGANGIIHVIDSVMLPTGQTADDSDPIQPASILEIAAEAGTFTTLLEALKVTDLTAALEGEGPFTVFAPTDEAFAKLPAETLEALLNDPSKLATILKYHVVSGRLLADSVLASNELATIADGRLVQVSTTAAGAAFINEAQILTTDIVGRNGVIHVIDSVLVPTIEPLPSLVDIAVGNDDFSVLVELLQAAGLVDALSGEGPFTVFAPTNAAFAKLDPALIDELMNNPDLLSSVLQYHVVGARLLAEDVLATATLATLTGATVAVRLSEAGSAFINDSRIVATDILGSNGVIHVIDSVLLPPR